MLSESHDHITEEGRDVKPCRRFGGYSLLKWTPWTICRFCLWLEISKSFCPANAPSHLRLADDFTCCHTLVTIVTVATSLGVFAMTQFQTTAFDALLMPDSAKSILGSQQKVAALGHVLQLSASQVYMCSLRIRWSYYFLCHAQSRQYDH